MICNKCGVKNRDTNKRCFYCGASLIKQKASIPVVEVVQAPPIDSDIEVSTDELEILEEVELIEEVEPIKEVETNEESEAIENILPQEKSDIVEEVVAEAVKTVDDQPNEKDSEDEAIESDETTDEVKDAPDEEKGNEGSSDSEDTKDNEASEETTPDEAQIDSVCVDEETEDVSDEDVLTKKPLKNKIIAFVLVALLIALIALIGYYIFKSHNQTSRPGEQEVIDATEAFDINAPEISVMTDDNGKEFINAKFYGKAGDVLTLNCNGKSYDFTSDVMELKLY